MKKLLFIAPVLIMTSVLSPHAATSEITNSPAVAKKLFFPNQPADTDALIKKDASAEIKDGKLKVTFKAGDGYPHVALPLPDKDRNLSAFEGIEIQVTNPGDQPTSASLRVDNPGDWQDEKWNTSAISIPAGETKTLRVRFGYNNYGTESPGYALDSSNITGIQIFLDKPKEDTTLMLSNLATYGNSGEPTAITTTTPAQTESVENSNSPAISGELFFPDRPAEIAGLTKDKVSTAVKDNKLEVTFQAGDSYPHIAFPIPDGGWNLSAYGGIEVKVTNPGTKPVTASIRVDNPGDWQDEKWNTSMLSIPPGETKKLQVRFGYNNYGTESTGYKLNPATITGIQVFLDKPKEDTTLLLSDLKAYGSPGDAAGKHALTGPEDRRKPVTPPAWLGERPPVPGDWVLTLDENFDGTTLNEKLWTTRYPWNGPMPGHLQRYIPENVILEDGKLRLKVEKNPGHENNDSKLDTRDYAAGLIQSYEKWTQLYGYFEARIKLPTTRSLWPAFWMMPDRGKDSGLDGEARRSTKNGGMEIDILEHLAEWGPGRYNVAAHWDDYGPDHKSWGSSHIYYGPTPDGWHVFGFLWEPGKLTWYIDGKKVVEWENERVGSVPNYLKMNVQMGGWATDDVDDASLPDYMEVDYIRAWQLKDRLTAKSD
ncbi:MAG: family 16 glycosylhydrolase [Chthoniobacterales bacterium]